MNFKTNGRVPLLLKPTGSVLLQQQQIGSNGDQIGQEGRLRAEERVKLMELDHSNHVDAREHATLHTPTQITAKTYLQGKHTLNSSSNGSNLALFLADGPDLRTNPFQLGEDDVILSDTRKEELEPEQDEHEAKELVAEDTLLAPIGPMTRSRTKDFNKNIGALLHQITNQEDHSSIGGCVKSTSVMIHARED